MTIADMSLDDLKRLIRQTIHEVRMDEDIDADKYHHLDDEPDARSLEEVFASIERNRWTPPPDVTPSQMIREDRDRQCRIM
jgi:hypothetical protein